MNIEVKDEGIKRLMHVDRLPRGTLSGKVVDGAGNPVSALIVGDSIGAPTHAGFTVQCKADGTFVTEKWNDKLRVIALSTEKRLFGTREIEADAEETEIVLAPAASLGFWLWMQVTNRSRDVSCVPTARGRGHD